MTEYVETQLTLTAWGVETFGPVQPLRLLIRGKEELVEAMRELSLHPDPIGFTGASAAAEECADTAIILFRAAHMFGFNLIEATDRTFDPGTGAAIEPLRCVSQADFQLAGAIRELAYGADPVFYREELARYIAGCYWWIKRCCVMLEHDIRQEIDAKMVVNRRRFWCHDGSGTGRHAREPQVASAARRA